MWSHRIILYTWGGSVYRPRLIGFESSIDLQVPGWQGERFTRNQERFGQEAVPNKMWRTKSVKRGCACHNHLVHLDEANIKVWRMMMTRHHTILGWYYTTRHHANVISITLLVRLSQHADRYRRITKVDRQSNSTYPIHIHSEMAVQKPFSRQFTFGINLSVDYLSTPKRVIWSDSEVPKPIYGSWMGHSTSRVHRIPIRKVTFELIGRETASIWKAVVVRSTIRWVAS